MYCDKIYIIIFHDFLNCLNGKKIENITKDNILLFEA